MLPSCTAPSEVRSSTTLMASCHVSSVDQRRFARSTSSTLPPQLSVTMSTGDARQQHHVSPFHVGPAATDFSISLGANHSLLSASVSADDQPLDLTGGGVARKRSASPEPADEDSPLDLSVKRSRTDDATPLSDFSTMGVGRAVQGGARGGLSMCGGGVVGQSPVRSVHVARSPVPPVSYTHLTLPTKRIV